MKRLISILMALCLMFTVLPMGVAFADEAEADEAVLISAEETAEEPEVNQAAEDALSYLTALGVLDEEATLSGGITRGEFAALAAKIGGYTGGDANANIFYDVTGENPYAEYINALASANIIGGFSSGNFLPDDAITIGEAVTILVRITGYGYRAESTGGFPAGYMQTAKWYDMLDNVSSKQSSTALSKEDALILLFNALDVDVMEQIVFGSDSEFVAREGKTLAYNTFKIVHLEGAVESVDLSALKGDNSLKAYYTKIDNTLVYIPDGNVWEYLGYNVDAYCEYDNREDYYTLKWIRKTNKNEEFVIDIEDIEDIGSGYIQYSTDDGVKKKKNFEKVAPVIFNGAATSKPFNMSLLEENSELLSGSVMLLDNDNDSVGDVIFVSAYTDIVASTVDSIGNTVYDAYSSARKIKIDTMHDPYTIVYSLEGEELGIGDIKGDDVLSVYKSQDDAYQQYWTIYRSNQRVEGKIVSIGGTEKKEIRFADATYEMTDACKTQFASKIKAGMNVTLLLNKAGKIAGINLGSTLAFAYIVAADAGSGLKGAVQLKVMTESGSIVIMSLASKVKIDEDLYEATDSEKILEVLTATSRMVYASPSDSGYIGQAIRYNTNTNGEINFIDTIAVRYKDGAAVAATSADISGDNALFAGPYGNHRYREGGYVFGEKFLANTSTKFLMHPDPTAADFSNEEEDYGVITVKNLTGGQYYNTMALYYKDDSMVASHVIFCGKDSGFSDTSYIGVVSGVYEALVKDKIGTIVEVTGKGGKVEVKFEQGSTFSAGKDADGNTVYMEPDDLKVGDVIRYKTNEITGYAYTEDAVVLYYRIQDGTTVTTASSDIGASFSLKYGYAADVASDGLKMLKTSDKSALKTATESDYIYVPKYSSCSYVLYDDSHPNEEQWVKTANWNSILSYKHAGDDCTQLIVQADVMTPRMMIIIKKKGAAE